MVNKKKWTTWLWDCWCGLSVIGIWPRFIEPFLLHCTKITLEIPSLSSQFNGFKILQFSDLHWNSESSMYLINKILKQYESFKPDLICFTGDFLCRAQLENEDALKVFLNRFKAPYGCFAVLGNHDYSQFVTVNSHGDYDIERNRSCHVLKRGFQRLFKKAKVTGKVSEQAKKLEMNENLEKLLLLTPFTVLRNSSKLIRYKNTAFNMCGLEEYSLGRCHPDLAFKNYVLKYPGIILTHNPDSFKLLANRPGVLLLAGHTHGGQINLPGLWQRFTRIENPEFKHGLKKIGDKWAYINRGISGLMKFRWFAMPELTMITLQSGENGK